MTTLVDTVRGSLALKLLPLSDLTTLYRTVPGRGHPRQTCCRTTTTAYILFESLTQIDQPPKQGRRILIVGFSYLGGIKRKREERRKDNNNTNNKYTIHKPCQIELFPAYPRITGLSHANSRTSDQIRELEEGRLYRLSSLILRRDRFP